MYKYFFIILLLYDICYSINLNVTNNPFDIMGSIITNNDIQDTCKASNGNNNELDILNIIILCNVLIISEDTIISPYTCIDKFKNIYLNYRDKLYEFDYILSKVNINITNYSNILFDNNLDNIVLIKLKTNITNYDNTNQINRTKTINDIDNNSEVNKTLTIKEEIENNKFQTLFNLDYPLIELNNIMYSTNLNLTNNYYYHALLLINVNINFIELEFNLIRKRRGNNILITTNFINNKLEYTIKCIETILYNYINVEDESIDIIICLPINDIYNDYIRNDLELYKEFPVIYDIILILEDNIYKYDYIRYDENCRIIN